MFCKKILSVCMAIIFVLSIVPITGMAEEATKTAEREFINYTFTRSGGNGGNNYYNQNIQARVNDIYAFAQIDFTGYEEILFNPSTTVSLTLQTGSINNSGVFYNMSASLAADKCDIYKAQELTWNSAQELGLNDIGKTIAEFDTETRDPAEAKAKISELQTKNVSIDDIRASFKEGSDNSLITLLFTSNYSPATWSDFSNAKLNINYAPSEIDDAAYAKEVVDGILWSNISADEISAVKDSLKLPQKLYGADISWSSSDETVINSAGEVIRADEKKSATLTATAEYKGEKYSKDFDVTVAAIVHEYTNVLDGDDTIVKSTSNYLEIDMSVDGNFGKAAGDKVYNVHDMVDPTYYINYPVDIMAADKRDDYMEFSICIPTNGNDVKISAGILNETGTNNASNVTTLEYIMKTDGLYYNSTKIYPVEADKWYNMVFVAPKGMGTIGVPSDGDDKTTTLYINGEIAHTVTLLKPTSYGFRTFRFYGTETDIAGDGYFLDNLRLCNGEYNPKYDAKAVVSGENVSATGNVITVKDATVESLENSLTKKDDTVIRIYDKSGKLKDNKDDTVSDGYTLVAAAKNGTDMERSYAYYNIKVTGESCAFDIPEINIENNIAKSEIKLYNNSNKDAQYTAYLAIYAGNELLRVVPVPVTADSGKISVTPIEAPISQGNTAKLMVWKDLVPQFVASEK